MVLWLSLLDRGPVRGVEAWFWAVDWGDFAVGESDCGGGLEVSMTPLQAKELFSACLSISLPLGGMGLETDNETSAGLEQGALDWPRC